MLASSGVSVKLWSYADTLTLANEYSILGKTNKPASISSFSIKPDSELS